jgi:hypothetical protein
MVAAGDRITLDYAGSDHLIEDFDCFSHRIWMFVAGSLVS